MKRSRQTHCTPFGCSACSMSSAEGDPMHDHRPTSRPSHNIRPGRRRRSPPPCSTLGVCQAILISLLVLAALCGTSEARAVDLRAEWLKAAPRTELVLDRALEPIADERPTHPLLARQDPLGGGGSETQAPQTQQPQQTERPQQTQTPATTTQATSKSSSGSSASKSTPVPTSTTSTGFASATTAPANTPLPIPKPFDSSLGNNFTSTSCPKFFDSFLSDESFVNCVPLSLLLQNSQAFFEASSKPETLQQVLDDSCNVVFPSCNALMNKLATEIKQSNNCGTDYSLGNPLVAAAYNGFLAYAPMYQAGCLKASASSSSSTSSGNYCFLASTMNDTNPEDSFIYSLPLGVPLPGASRPTCSSCLQQTMAIFATSAQNLTQPLSGDYTSAATQVNLGCGPNFVNATVKPLQGSSPTSGAVGQSSRGLGLVISAALGVGFLLV